MPVASEHFGAGRPQPRNRQFFAEQIFCNLFDNGREIQEPAAPVTAVLKAYAVGRSALRIEVPDNGRGIGAIDHERVFELFPPIGLQ